MALVPLARIRADKDVQPRAETDPDVVNDYALAILDNASFPPIVVFFDGKDYWLADGFHRHEAICAIVAERNILNPGTECEVREGGRRDAILYACGANDAHGLRRTNKDKRRAVRRLLKDPEWSQWADREIARACNVSQPFVGKLRPTENVISDDARKGKGSKRKYRNKHGTTSEMAVDGINADRKPVQTDIEDITNPPQPLPVNDGTTEYDWYADKLRAIDAAITALPAPDVTVRNFPRSMCSVMTPQRALEIQRWWQEFTRLYGARQPEFERYRARFARKKESA